MIENSTLQNKDTYFFKGLWLCVALIFAMIIIGGWTRLAGAGLSIVHWDLVTGILPPLTKAQWLDAFHAYQSSPEYQKINYGLSLDHFKNIFWLEFVHRLWGRAIGIVVLTLTYMAWRNLALRHHYFKKMLGLWLLVAAQGAVGWFMVKSGLVNDPHVCHYRLALHLLLGFTTYGITFNLALGAHSFNANQYDKIPQSGGFWILWILFILTTIYGAFVAGLKAGLIYNTFPTMDGAWWPDAPITALSFLKDHGWVQWTHRCLALTTATAMISYALYHKKALAGRWIIAAVCVQIILGVATLLMHVPVWLGVLHQMGALFVLSALIYFYHAHIKYKS